MFQQMLRAGALAVFAICSGCVHRNVIELAPGSTPDSLFFVVRAPDASALPGPFPGLALVRCMDGLPMEIDIVQDSGMSPTRPQYERVAMGQVFEVRPQPLLPDCYEAVSPGATRLRFFVDVDGNIIIPR